MKIAVVVLAIILALFLCSSFSQIMSEESNQPILVIGFAAIVLLIANAGRHLKKAHRHTFWFIQILIGMMVLVTRLETSGSPDSDHVMFVIEYFAALFFFIEALEGLLGSPSVSR